MTQVLQRTVLFADLRGSTSMYETLGNADATAVVTRSVALLARIVAAHRGQVVKTLGDGLMAVFESPAESVAAADDMHDSLARIGMADEAQARRGQRRAGRGTKDSAAARRPCRRGRRCRSSCRSASRTARSSRCRATSSATPSTSPPACSTTPATTRRWPRPASSSSSASGSGRAFAASTRCSCAAASSRCTCTCRKPCGASATPPRRRTATC